MALKLAERATCCKAVLVSCSRDWCGHAEAFLVHGNAYQAHPQHVPHLVSADWSFGPGREAAATGQPRWLWRSLRRGGRNYSSRSQLRFEDGFSRGLSEARHGRPDTYPAR